jgi:hypothetical protein
MLVEGMMVSDPLSLTAGVGEWPSEVAYQAVHAELMATEGGRNFLAEYARRNLDPDTRKFVSTVARLESAMRDHHVKQISATMFQGLTELARAIEQSEAIFSAGGDTAANDLLAIERIQDIGMALRRRDVEPALCDALELAVREIGDARVRSNAAAAGMSSTASLLRDLSVLVNDFIALHDSATSLGTELPAASDARHKEPRLDKDASCDDAEALLNTAAEKTADDETQGDTDAGRFDHTVDEAAIDSRGANVFGPEYGASQSYGFSVLPPGSDGDLQVSLERESGAQFAPQLESVPKITNTSSEQEAQAENALPHDILRPMEPATQRAPQSESLRAILALSEAELIALFA